MSLLDTGPDTLTIWPEIETTNARGTTVRVPGPTPVTVQCQVQPQSSDESAADGQTVTTLCKVIARDFPAGPWARIEWDGREWDPIGEPLRYHRTPRIAHATVMIRARTPIAVPNG